MNRERKERLIYLDYLIRTHTTGTPEQLAQKLGLSTSGWYRLRDVLVNDLDWPLAFDPYRCTYYYTENVMFVFGFKRLDAGEAARINGGAAFFSENFSHSTFSRVEVFSFAFNL